MEIDLWMFIFPCHMILPHISSQCSLFFTTKAVWLILSFISDSNFTLEYLQFFLREELIIYAFQICLWMNLFNGIQFVLMSHSWKQFVNESAILNESLNECFSESLINREDWCQQMAVLVSCAFIHDMPKPAKTPTQKHTPAKYNLP